MIPAEECTEAIGRNSPIATRLVSADVGDEREIDPEGKEYFKVTEARTFEGPTSLHLAGERPVLLHCYTSTAVIEKMILERIASANEYATIAVIFANEQDAANWHGRLSGELAAGRRPASLSRREDLVGRFDIHFTHVYETKGLEFDVVVIPDLEAFDLESEIGRNQLYVAVSRAKHALFLGWASKRQNKEIAALIEGGFVRKIELD